MTTRTWFRVLRAAEWERNCCTPGISIFFRSLNSDYPWVRHDLCDADAYRKLIDMHTPHVPKWEQLVGFPWLVRDVSRLHGITE